MRKEGKVQGKLYQWHRNLGSGRGTSPGRNSGGKLTQRITRRMVRLRSKLQGMVENEKVGNRSWDLAHYETLMRKSRRKFGDRGI